jgi:hypothetical protein
MTFSANRRLPGPARIALSLASHGASAALVGVARTASMSSSSAPKPAAAPPQRSSQISPPGYRPVSRSSRLSRRQGRKPGATVLRLGRLKHGRGRCLRRCPGGREPKESARPLEPVVDVLQVDSPAQLATAR